ncbi:hypothetical protein CHLRE_06g291500v5 [Chlamydomonas reinhardtii]|uniref:RWP-RK domain-containing protein n=1 Tax=Chlamydomonas reinhardtii TaxID=3055 RepID=A0A2K3DQA9_CHLRE|nr:uncharacterized protein CHLRE_06g291500v5 [Chlamydomonas reinhardtii]PNW82724.1 hypothetical protein CHLRE_06g291500v5 [Chlamydomonas reinhardtii]
MASPGMEAPSVDDLIRRSQCLNADDGDRELLELGANPDLLLTSQPDVWMAADRGGGDGGDSYDADPAHQALRHLPTAVAAQPAGSGQVMAFSASPASAAVGAAATIDALLRSPCGIANMPAAHASDWLSAPAVFGNAVLDSAIPTPAQVLTAAAAAGRGGDAAACGGNMAAMRLDQQLLAELPCISGPAALPSFWGGRTGMTTVSAAMETSRGGLLLSGTAAAGGAFSSSATHGRPSSSAMLLQPPLLAQPTCMPQLPAQTGGALLFRPPQPQPQSGSCTDAVQLAKEWRSGYDEFLMSEGGPAGDFLDWGGGCGAAMPPPPPPPLQPYSGSNYSSAGSQQLQQSPWSTGGALQAVAAGNNSLTLLHTVGGRLAHMQQGRQRQGPAQTLSASGAVAAPGFTSGVIGQAFCTSANATATATAVAERLRTRKQKHAQAPMVGSSPRVLDLLEPEPAGVGASGTYVLGPDGEPPREYQRSLQQPASASQLPRLSQPASPLQLRRLQHPQPAQSSQPLPLPLPQSAPLLQLPPPLRPPEPKEPAAWRQQAPAAPAAAEVGPAGTGDVHVVVKLDVPVATAVSQQAYTGVGAAQLRLVEAMDVQQEEQEKVEEAEEDPEPGAEKMAAPAGAAKGADSGAKSWSSRQGPRAAVGHKAAQAREKARAAVGWPLEEAAGVSMGCSSGGGGGNAPRASPEQDDEDDGCCDTGAADDDDDDDDDGPAGNGRDGRVITVDDLRHYYEVPIKEAARRLGYSVSCLKNICRRLGVPNWPSRKLLTLQKMRGALLGADAAANGIRAGGAGAASGQEAAEARLERERLLERLALNIADIYADPHTPMYPEFMRVRQLQYKSRANARLARRSCSGRAGGGSISSSKAADSSRSGSKAADGSGSGTEGGGRGEESRGRAAGGVAKRRARRDRSLRGICEDTKEGSEVMEGSQDME